MKKLLSIIVPYYNSMPYFPAMLDSLEPQITDEIEVIFVNDGSTDESAEQLSRFSDNKNVKTISIPHAGVSAARNAGIAEAQGDYLWYMDSDDMLCEGIVDVILDHIRSYNGEPDMFFGDLLALEDDDPDDLKKVHFSFDQYLGKVHSFSEPFSFFYEELRICSMLGSSIFRRAFCQENKIVFNEKMAFGETMVYRTDILLKNPLTAFINEPLYVFRIHDKDHPSLRQKMPSKEVCLNMIHEYEKIFHFFLYDYPFKQGRQYMIYEVSPLLFGIITLYVCAKCECVPSQLTDEAQQQLKKLFTEEEKILTSVTIQELLHNLPPEMQS